MTPQLGTASAKTLYLPVQLGPCLLRVPQPVTASVKTLQLLLKPLVELVPCLARLLQPVTAFAQIPQLMLALLMLVEMVKVALLVRQADWTETPK